MLRLINIWLLLRLLQEHTDKPREDNRQRFQDAINEGVFFYANRKHVIEYACTFPLVIRIMPLWFRLKRWTIENDTPNKEDITGEWFEMNSYLNLALENEWIENNVVDDVEQPTHIRITLKGYDFITYFGLFETMLTKHKLTWAFIIIPFIPWIYHWFV